MPLPPWSPADCYPMDQPQRLASASSANPMPTAVRVALPGTCGELVQGTLYGEPCLISCPIGCYNRVDVGFQPRPGWEVPAEATKTAAALQAGLAYLGHPGTGGYVRLHRQLPQGRGYGSSTADIGATLYALGQAVGRALTAPEVSRLAVQVEPTDSSLFPGLALWNHRTGQGYEEIGSAPDLAVVVLDPGGEVDTLAFNRVDYRRVLEQLAPQHREAFALVRQGVQQGDGEAIGAAATLSATVHQVILDNPWLAPALTLAREVKALGVCRAHSGTLLGLLLDPRSADIAAITALAARRLAPAVTVFSQPLVGGGPRWLTDNTRRRSR